MRSRSASPIMHNVAINIPVVGCEGFGGTLKFDPLKYDSIVM